MSKKPTNATPNTQRPSATKALSQVQVRRLLAEGRKVREDLERRVEKMHRVTPADAAARAR